jgi:hypothetical protein
LAAVFFQASSVCAAVTLLEVVRENQMGGNLVKDVSVSALGANPVITGADGQFVFHFPQRQTGEDVSIGVSRKAGERETWALQFYRLQGECVMDARYKKELAASGSEERPRLLREQDRTHAQADELPRQLAARPVAGGIICRVGGNSG